jgi:hypothetical protein
MVEFYFWGKQKYVTFWREQNFRGLDYSLKDITFSLPMASRKSLVFEIQKGKTE